jgi:hypothetical protein
VINNTWASRLKSHEYISDRIAKAIFELPQKHKLDVINIYASTQARANSNEAKTEEVYSELTRQVKSHDTKYTTTVVAGDFNAKVGQRGDGEECMGRFTRGRRNNNGQMLVDFCHENKLIAANSLFEHRASHMTT